MSSPTIDDVAKQAKVSIKTVSRVVNREPNVRKETREKVQHAIDLLGYTPNLSARRLAAKRSFLVGLVYDNFHATSAYVVNVQCGVMASCSQSGYELLIHPLNVDNATLINEVIDFTHRSQVDCLVLPPPLSDHTHLCNQLAAQNIPFVRLSPVFNLNDSLYVQTNDRSAAFDMTMKLIELGHSDIAFVAGRPDHYAVSERHLGFVDAMQSAALPIREEWIKIGASTFDSGKDCGVALLKNTPRPTAIFAGNDEMAAGVMSIAHTLGIRIPEDLSVAGFDDSDLARQSWPALTSVRQPVQAMAKAAADLLFLSLKTPSNTDLSRCFACEIILRDSTGPTIKINETAND